MATRDYYRSNYLPELRRALAFKSERAAQKLLDVTHRPLYVLFARGWNNLAVVPQFAFGSDYRADYLVLSAHSGGVFATLIELESPDARLFLKDGTPSRTLRTAQRQVSDWQAWIAASPSRFRCEILTLLASQSRNGKDRRFPGVRARLFRQSLEHYHQLLRTEFVIIIGRRRRLSESDQERRIRPMLPDTEIVTYDRLLDVARRDFTYHQEAAAVGLQN